MAHHDQHSGAYAHGGGVFVLDAKLPQQVFAGRKAGFIFCEFDAVLSKELWPALSTMARWHGDPHVELRVVEPGGHFPVVTLPVDADEDEYWSAIGYERADDPLGSIALSAEVVAITGPSGRWGCWGERGPELAVFCGFPSTPQREMWQERFGPFFGVPEALEDHLPLVFADRKVPDDYAAALMRNYDVF